MNKTFLAGAFLAILAFFTGCTTATEQSNEQPIAQNVRPPVTVTNFVIVTNFVTITNFVAEPTEQHVPDKALGQQAHPSNLTQQSSLNPQLTDADVAYLRQQGLNDAQITSMQVSQPTNEPNSTSQMAINPTPSDLKGAIIYMDSFLGMANQTVVGDVISMSSQALKFRLNGQDYGYSGNYTVVLNTPRQHRNPYFGFGSPEMAKILVLDDFGGQNLFLQDATVWEKDSNFIDVESDGKEWIYSGTYTIQN